MARYKPVSYDQALIVPVILNCNWGNGKMGAGVEVSSHTFASLNDSFTVLNRSKSVNVRLFVFDHFQIFLLDFFLVFI